jgi:hypothetical protein
LFEFHLLIQNESPPNAETHCCDSLTHNVPRGLADSAPWWIPFIIGSAAFCMMVLSWMPHFRVQVMDPEFGTMVDSFDPVLAIGEWLLTLFAVSHFYPPMPWLRPSTK